MCHLLVPSCIVCIIQSRLTRCAQQCEDDLRDSVPVGGGNQPSPKDQERAQQCLIKCCEDNSHFIPKLVSKFKASLKSC